MTRRAYLYFALTFVLGLIVGAAGLLAFAWHGHLWQRTIDKAHILGHLGRELKLSDTQMQQLDPVVADWMKRQEELKKEVEPRFREAREEFRNRVRKILDPEQLAKFNEISRRRDERMKPK